MVSALLAETVDGGQATVNEGAQLAGGYHSVGLLRPPAGLQSARQHVAC